MATFGAGVKPLRLALFVVGLILFLAGLTFALQGYGVIGPGSSFMFENRTWVYTGSTILVIGFLLVCAGVYLRNRSLVVRPAASST